MIRQSAMHRQGRNATGARGGVDPRTSLGPIPIFRYFYLQAGQDCGQQLTDGNGASMTVRLLLQNMSNDFRFVATRVVGKLPNNSF